MIMKSTRTIKTEVVSSKPDEIIFKLQQEYTPKPMPIAKKVNSLVTLTLDGEGKVRYHKVRRVRCRCKKLQGFCGCLETVLIMLTSNRTCGTRRTIAMKDWGKL
jgi:hypothetical protein